MKRSIHKIGIHYGYLLIIAVYLVLQLIFLPQFGLTADEPILEYRADLALKYIKQVFTTGDFRFEVLSPGIQSHPVFYSLIVRFFSQLMQGMFSLPYYQSMHVLNILVSAFGIGILFVFTKKIFGQAAAYACLLFFFICPRLWAHAHYNPKDMPAMVFSLAAVYHFYRAMREDENKALIWAVLFWILALSTKLSVILLSPVFAVIVVQKPLRKFIVFVLFSAAGIYLLWPYLWARPFFFFEALGTYASDFQNFPVLYRGAFFSNTALPFHYYLFYFVSTLPVMLILFFILGLIFLLQRKRVFVILIFSGCWFLLPLVLNSLPGISRYDGFRQLFYILPPVFMTAAYGMVRLIHLVLRRKLPRGIRPLISWALPTAVAVMMLPAFFYLHPFEGAYFNALFRTANKEDIQERFHFDYWGASYLQAAEMLSSVIKEDTPEDGRPARVYVPVFPWVMDAYSKNSGFIVTLDQGDADYVVSLSRFNRRNQPGYFSGLPAAGVLQRYRSDLCRIYQLP